MTALQRAARVAALLLLGTGCAGDPTGPSTTALVPGAAIALSGAAGSERYFTVDVPAGTAGLRVSLLGGTGDADLYLRLGTRPTPGGVDCASENFGGDESCFIPAPSAGVWYVAVIGYEPYDGVSLLAEFAAPPTPTPLTSGVAVPDLAAAQGATLYFSIDVPAGTGSLTVSTTGGTGDADLYLRRGTPQLGGATCVSSGSTSAETCTVTTPTAGTWIVMLHGWLAYSGVSLTATLGGAPVVEPAVPAKLWGDASSVRPLGVPPRARAGAPWRPDPAR